MLSIENKISSGQLGLPDATIDLLTAKITEALFTNYDIPGYQAQIAQMSAELAVLKSELRTASSNGNNLTEADVARIVANSGLSANTVTNWANANGTTISKEYIEADKVVLDTAMKSDKTIMEALEDAKKLLNNLSEGKMDTETVNKTVKEMTDIINTLNTAVAALSDKTSDEDGALRAYLQALADELSQTRAMLSESAASDKTELTQNLNDTKQELETNMASDKAELTQNLNDTKQELETNMASDKAELTQNLNDTKQELETNMTNNKSELQNQIQEVSDLLDQTVDEINNNLTTQLNQLQSDLSTGLGAANDRMDAMNVYTAYAKNITYDATNGLTAEGFSLTSTADSRFIGTSLTIESSAPTDPSAYNWTPYRDYSITLEGTTLTVNIDPSTNP